MPSNFDFNPALRNPIKWTVSENNYDENGKNPRQLSLAIPIDSIPDFINYLMALEADTSKHKPGKVWDFSNNEEKEVDVVWINAKGKAGQYGDLGNINPQRIEPSGSSEELPF